MNNHGKLSVLVVDGGPRHTIDIARSLGKRGVNVSVVTTQRFPPVRFSRYLNSAIVSSVSAWSCDTMLPFLEDLGRRQHFDVIIAAGLDGFRVLSYGLERLNKIAKVPVASFDAFSIAEDKAETVSLAQEAGVPVPETYCPTGITDLDNYQNIRYPVAVKARRGYGHYGFANNFEELRHVYSQICAEVPEQIDNGLFPIIQDYIPGKGHGFYALMNRGVVKAYFMHERIHEVPPIGGPSALAKSYYDEDLIEVGTAILSALKWHGVAMVEFKKDVRDSQYKLLEINPKFWGSLGLSIAAGIDFPYLLIKVALDGDIEPVHPPKTPISYQWLSMDIAHAWAVRKPWLWLGPVLQGVSNDFSISDPLPNLMLLAQGGWDVISGHRRIHNLGGNRNNDG